MTREARDRLGAGLALLVVITLLAGSTLAALLVFRLADRDPSVPVDQTSSPGVTAGVEEPGSVTDPGVTTDPPRGRPLRLQVPDLEIDVEVVAIGLQDGVMVPPFDPTRIGWWRDGAVPGAARGTALLAGHTYSVGDGAFDDLGLLGAGDRFTITTSRGQLTYLVEAVRAYTKDQLAAVAERLFSQTVAGRAVLITCTDYRDDSYHANVVVVASPVRQPH